MNLKYGLDPFVRSSNKLLKMKEVTPPASIAGSRISSVCPLDLVIIFVNIIYNDLFSSLSINCLNSVLVYY